MRKLIISGLLSVMSACAALASFSETDIVLMEDSVDVHAIMIAPDIGEIQSDLAAIDVVPKPALPHAVQSKHGFATALLHHGLQPGAPGQTFAKSASGTSYHLRI